MRPVRWMAVAAIVGGLSGSAASAEPRYDVGLLLGATRASNDGTVLEFDRGTTYQATFAWRVWERGTTRVSIEVPFIATAAFGVASPGALLPKEYASLYLTPGVRLTFWPNGRVSIFGAAGGGYARYSESKLRADNGPNPAQQDTDTGAVQFGGGLDVRGFGWLGFRGEVRDVYTGARNFSLPTPHESVHNVIASGGLTVRF